MSDLTELIEIIYDAFEKCKRYVVKNFDIFKSLKYENDFYDFYMNMCKELNVEPMSFKTFSEGYQFRNCNTDDLENNINEFVNIAIGWW